MAKKAQPALPRIFTLRGRRVVLDSALAALDGVPTSRLNEAVKRNTARFPDDFRFQITAEEFVNLKSQIATSSSDPDRILRSQLAILDRGEKGGTALKVGARLRAISPPVGPATPYPIARKRAPTIDFFAALLESVDRLQPLFDAPEAGDDPKPKIGFHRGNR